MKKIEIKPFSKEIILSYSGEGISLPEAIKGMINDYWRQLILKGKAFTRGDVFTIRSISETDRSIHIDLFLTDYAHYIATINGILKNGSFLCKVIYSAVLIKTNDGYFALGQMGQQTSTPGRIQCPGGGITKEDLTRANTIDIARNAAIELFEETGLRTDSPDYSCGLTPKYIKTGGDFDFIGIVFIAETSLSRNALYDLFSQHNKNLIKEGQSPELMDLIFIKDSPSDVAAFFEHNTCPTVDYLECLLTTDTTD